MRKLGLVLVAVAVAVVASCSGKVRPHKVDAVCGAMMPKIGSVYTQRPGRQLLVVLVLALDGSETVTQAADPSQRIEKAGDKAPRRVLLGLSCEAFLPDGIDIAIALKDERERPKCDVTVLDLLALDAGKPFSLENQPSVRHWRIQSIAPGFASIDIGEGEGRDIRITGISQRDSERLSTSGARVGWDYTSGYSGGGGMSRVDLAADCPAI